jgi:hypothetical protein
MQSRLNVQFICVTFVFLEENTPDGVLKTFWDSEWVNIFVVIYGAL